MHILVLCKRRYTGKDLLKDRYGRLWELPAELANKGHTITGIAAAYRSESALDPAGWCSVQALPHPRSLAAAWRPLLPNRRPDVIWASSDAAHLVAATRLARDWDVPVVLDHYDDYEAFGLTRWAGLRTSLRKATGAAAAVTAVGRRLRRTLIDRGASQERVHVVSNGVPSSFGVAMDQSEARHRLGLPVEGRLFGMAGALDASRGLSDLGGAARLLAGAARLVVAGPGSRQALGRLPADVIDLGMLSHGDVAVLYRALDVGVVCNRDSDFGRHCYPMKLVEMQACELPVVAAAVGEAESLLRGHPESLYPTGNATVLAHRIKAHLDSPKRPTLGAAWRWPDLADTLETVLRSAVDSARR